MFRTLSCFVLLVAAARAQDDRPIILAGGSGLEDFRVSADPARVGHSSPRALAESFARYYLDQIEVARRFEIAFSEAHLAILGRYLDGRLVDKQRSVYDGGAKRPPVARFEGGKIEGQGADRALASLTRGWLDRKSGERIERGTRLRLVKRSELWWIESVDEQEPEGGYRPRPIDLSPAHTAPAVPAAREPDRSSVDACVSSLKDEIRRLALLTRRARREMSRSQPRLLSAFYGEQAVKDALARLEPRPPRDEVLYRVETPSEVAKGVYAVAVTALEEVKDDPGATSPVGQVLYKLRKADDGWRIVAEAIRPAIDQPHVPNKRNFGLFFLQ